MRDDYDPQGRALFCRAFCERMGRLGYETQINSHGYGPEATISCSLRHGTGVKANPKEFPVDGLMACRGKDWPDGAVRLAERDVVCNELDDSTIWAYSDMLRKKLWEESHEAWFEKQADASGSGAYVWLAVQPRGTCLKKDRLMFRTDKLRKVAQECGTDIMFGMAEKQIHDALIARAERIYKEYR